MSSVLWHLFSRRVVQWLRLVMHHVVIYLCAQLSCQLLHKGVDKKTRASYTIGAKGNNFWQSIASFRQQVSYRNYQIACTSKYQIISNSKQVTDGKYQVSSNNQQILNLFQIVSIQYQIIRHYAYKLQISVYIKQDLAWSFPQTFKTVFNMPQF